MMHIDCIESITFEYGGFCDGTEKRTISHNGDEIVVDREFYNGLSDDGIVPYEGKTWTELLEDLESVSIDDWDEEYDDLDVLDGTQWSLDIEYNDGTESRHYWGSNKYPKNFDDFLEIIEMER